MLLSILKTRPIALVSLLCLGSLAAAQVRYRGMSYVSWNKNDYAMTASNKSLESMRTFGVDTVAINAFEFQETILSTRIAPDYTAYSASPGTARVAIRKAKALGMKVMLKPIVDLSKDSAHWRGDIKWSAAWSTAYKGFVKRWADLAQEEGVDLFCIGCEMDGTIANEAFWRSTISLVRSRFTGIITYAANYNTERAIEWWDALDIIGIDAYYGLTNKTNPTQTELNQAWKARAIQIRNWRNTVWPTKQVMFTEVGYRSTDGANINPWSWGTDNGIDLYEQRDCYKALFNALWAESWWAGAFWWDWETDPRAGGKTNQDYTPQNKPAWNILKFYYSK